MTTASLCVEVLPLRQDSERGEAATWTVTTWTTGGTAPGAVVTLRAAPAGSGTPKFTVGCAQAGAAPACPLGDVSPAAARRQLEAQVTVPLASRGVTSVTLTATVSAAGLHPAPAASGTVTVLSPPAPASATTTPLPVVPAPVPAAAPIANPALAPVPSLSSGGDAGTLFPVISPRPDSGTATTRPGGTRQVADTTTLSGGVSPVGPALIGAGALALMLIIAATHLQARRPRAASKSRSRRRRTWRRGRQPGVQVTPREPGTVPVDLEAT